jgi:hypothetical protein
MRIEDLRKSFENLNFSVRLSNWGKEDLYDFILSALTIMSMWTESKLNYFWKNGEEESALGGWIDCLEVITANSVIVTLESVRDGHYKKYEDLIPRSAIDFKHFALTGNHKRSTIQNYSQEPSNLLRLNYNSDEHNENKVWFNSLTDSEKNRHLQQALYKFSMLKYHLEHNKISVLDKSFSDHFLFKMLMEVLGKQKVTPQRKRSEGIARENLKKIREMLKTSFRKPNLEAV